MISSISENGKYVAGADAYGTMFVADWAAGNVVLCAEGDDAGGHARAVSNDGLAVGVNGQATTLSIDGTVKVVSDGDDAILSGVTPDGSMIVGEYNVESAPIPSYWTGGERFDLPQLTDERANMKCLGTAGRFVSGDGAVIAGHFVDKMSTRPLVVWHRNRDGKTYSIDPVFRRFCFKRKGYLQIMTPSALSNNGKWVAVSASKDGKVYLGRYDVENDSLQFIDYPLEGDDVCESSGIADDGTLIGVVTKGDEETGGTRIGLICPAGESKAVSIAGYYPDLDDLAVFDQNGANVPMAITPDGRYIAGYGIAFSGDNQIYRAYVIDTKASPSAVDGIAAGNGSSPDGAEAYTVDGVRVPVDSLRGFGIVKKADGRAVKVVK